MPRHVFLSLMPLFSFCKKKELFSAKFLFYLFVVLEELNSDRGNYSTPKLSPTPFQTLPFPATANILFPIPTRLKTKCAKNKRKQNKNKNLLTDSQFLVPTDTVWFLNFGSGAKLALTFIIGVYFCNAIRARITTTITVPLKCFNFQYEIESIKVKGNVLFLLDGGQLLCENSQFAI